MIFFHVGIGGVDKIHPPDYISVCLFGEKYLNKNKEINYFTEK